METFQRSSALLNIKYNCAALFLRQMHWLFMYASNIFSYRKLFKTQSELFYLEKTEFTEHPTE